MNTVQLHSVHIMHVTVVVVWLLFFFFLMYVNIFTGLGVQVTLGAATPCEITISIHIFTRIVYQGIRG